MAFEGTLKKMGGGERDRTVFNRRTFITFG